MSRQASPPPEEVFVTLRWGSPSSAPANGLAASNSTSAAALLQNHGRAAGDAHGRGDEEGAALRARVEELEGVVATTGAELAIKDAELAVALRTLERRQMRIEALKHELEEVRKDAHAELTKKELLIESLHADIEELRCALDERDASPKLEEDPKFWFQLSDGELSDSDSGDEGWPSRAAQVEPAAQHESVPAERDAAVVEECRLGHKRVPAVAERFVVFKTKHAGWHSGVLCKPVAQLRRLTQLLEKSEEDPWICRALFGVVLFFNPWLRVVRWLVC